MSSCCSIRSSACSFCFLIFSTMRCHSQTADTPQKMSSFHHLFSNVYTRITRPSALKDAASAHPHPLHHNTPYRQRQRSSGSCCRRPRGSKNARRSGISSRSPCSADGISRQACCPGNRSKSPPGGSGVYRLLLSAAPATRRLVPPGLSDSGTQALHCPHRRRRLN
jgi:hypothetical protein